MNGFIRHTAIATLGGLLALGLSGCGPIYSTHYTFVPPQDANGKLCVSQCNNTREMCRALEESRAAQEQATCQQNASWRYSMCLSNAKDEQARKACNPNAYCSRSANTERCESDYRQCYQNCGGTVNSYQVCDFGC